MDGLALPFVAAASGSRLSGTEKVVSASGTDKKMVLPFLVLPYFKFLPTSGCVLFCFLNHAPQNCQPLSTT